MSTKTIDCVVGNRDRCGRCHVRHGGNDHSCRLHGPVSAGCCDQGCTESLPIVERRCDTCHRPIMNLYAAYRGRRLICSICATLGYPLDGR